MNNSTTYKAVNKTTGEEYVMIPGTDVIGDNLFSFDVTIGEENKTISFNNNNGVLTNDEYDAVIVEPSQESTEVVE